MYLPQTMELGDGTHKGRGPVAVQDMKNRLAAGWDFSRLWDRNWAAVMGEGHTYDMAEWVHPDEQAAQGSPLEHESATV